MRQCLCFTNASSSGCQVNIFQIFEVEGHPWAVLFDLVASGTISQVTVRPLTGLLEFDIQDSGEHVRSVFSSVLQIHVRVDIEPDVHYLVV